MRRSPKSRYTIFHSKKSVIAGAPAFTPVTNTYTSGTAATENVPAGATQVVITADGGGGAGGRSAVLGGGGGGGGSRAVKTIAVTTGNTFTYTVAAAVAGRSTNGKGTDGEISLVDGTVAGGTVNIDAGGGAGASLNASGAAGTASGGDTNTDGIAGDAALGIDGDGNGGTGAGGGAGGIAPEGAGSAIGGGGAGSTSGTSGAGARGEISFAYT